MLVNILSCIDEKLEKIAIALEAQIQNTKLIGVKVGSLGIAMFYFEYYKRTRNERYRRLATQVVLTCFEKIESPYDSRFLELEIAEFGWFLEYSRKNIKVETGIDSDAILSEIDVVLQNLLARQLTRKNFDTCEGAVMLGFYFLARLDTNPAVVDPLLNILDALEKALGSPKGETSFFEMENYYLGVSHGIAGILLFLVRFYESDLQKEKCRLLISAFSDKICESYREENYPLNFFPVRINQSTREKDKFCWSYSDIGITYALLRSAQAVNNTEMEARTLRILKISSSRNSYETTRVSDIGLWYGTSGIALAYLSIYRITGDIFFKDQSTYWINETLNFATLNDPASAGFPMKLDVGADVNHISCLVHGITGVGLSLLSYLETEKKKGFEEFIYMV